MPFTSAHNNDFVFDYFIDKWALLGKILLFIYHFVCIEVSKPPQDRCFSMKHQEDHSK